MYAIVTKDIATAVETLKQGRVVAVPTGTSYGLAADALQGHALQRLRNLKQRPAEKSFTVFLDPSLWAEFLELTADERSVLERLPGKPLTLLVKPQASLQHLAQGGLLGLRVIDHPLMAALALEARVPLTATSANVSGGPPCFTLDAVLAAFPGKLAGGEVYDLSLGVVLDGGSLPAVPPSTIAKVRDGKIEIMRPGGLAETELASAARKQTASPPTPAA
jgi:L-threonylcarbamoyladenylate synthase